jgi:uncharacterized cupredoxin-like copper-binding protein
MKNMYARGLHLLGILALGIVLAGCGDTASSSSAPARATVGGSAQQAGGAQGSAAGVSVAAKEFAFALDPSQAKAGGVTFAVTNSGATQHDFKITGNGVEQKTPLLEPGKSASLTVDLRPGTYTYICTVPGHEALGMKGSFTVNQ